MPFIKTLIPGGHTYEAFKSKPCDDSSHFGPSATGLSISCQQPKTLIVKSDGRYAVVHTQEQLDEDFVFNSAIDESKALYKRSTAKKAVKKAEVEQVKSKETDKEPEKKRSTAGGPKEKAKQEHMEDSKRHNEEAKIREEFRIKVTDAAVAEERARQEEAAANRLRPESLSFSCWPIPKDSLKQPTTSPDEAANTLPRTTLQSPRQVFDEFEDKPDSSPVPAMVASSIRAREAAKKASEARAKAARDDGWEMVDGDEDESDEEWVNLSHPLERLKVLHGGLK